MSENLLATVITIAILAGIVLWVPLLNVFCPPCGRFVSHLRRGSTARAPESTSSAGDPALDIHAA